MYKKYPKRFLPILLCAALVMSFFSAAAFAPAAAPKNPPKAEEWYIGTAEELLELSELCRLDVWSVNKTVILTADISLAGMNFVPIPSFSGTFDGAGHTIRDMEIIGSFSPCGLFSRIEESGQVLRLHVNGTCAPSGKAGSIGGIAGESAGLIADCTFTGTVAGKDLVGGIVGSNEYSGCVQGCTVYGSITGYGMTGGIAGKSCGSIFSCVNESYINITDRDPVLNLNDIDVGAMLESFSLLPSDTLAVTQDTGGIAGYSSGVVSQCKNRAVIGYQHIGYNVGGIVGRSCGYIDSCTNEGEVYGRKDVGGIVGQAEPYVDILSESNLTASLAGQFKGLNYAMDRAIADSEAFGDQLAGSVGGLAAQLAPLAGTIGSVDITDPDSLENALSALGSAASVITGALSGMSGNISASGAALAADMSAVNDSIGGIGGAAAGIISSMTDPDSLSVIHDTSAEKISAVTFGRVTACTNSGTVYGDINSAGIAGQVSVEDVLNPEDDLQLSLGTTRTEYEYKAILDHCINNGSVRSRKDGAGGITGRLTLGYVYECESYGMVETENGSYTGGIAGYSMSRIEKCWIRSTLSGGSYVGGVIGSGSEDSSVLNCRAVVAVRDAEQFMGAVSGSFSGNYLGNLFVSDVLQGINGRNISGQAEPVEASVFLQAEELPEGFSTYTVTFEAEGTVLKTLELSRSEQISRNQLPAIPEKDGYFASWGDIDFSAIHTDMIISAQYTRCSSILPSNLVRTDGRAAMYAEGAFPEGESFLVTVCSVDSSELSELRFPWYRQLAEQFSDLLGGRTVDPYVCRDILECLTMEIPADGGSVHTMRYLPPAGTDGEVRLFLASPEGYVKLHPARIGSYYSFEVQGAEAEVAVFSTVRTLWLLVIGVVVLLALAVTAFAVLRSIRKRRLRALRQKILSGVDSRVRKISRDKRDTFIATVLGAVVLFGIVFCAVYFSPTGQRMQAAAELKRLLREGESAWEIHVEGESGTPFSYDCSFENGTIKGKQVNCISMEGITLCYAGDSVYLPNGRGFRVSSSLPDRSVIISQVRDIFLKGDLSSDISNGCRSWQVTAAGEAADAAAALLIPGFSAESFHVNSLEAGALAQDGKLISLQLTAEGENRYGKDFHLHLTAIPVQQSLEISEAVSLAIFSGERPEQELTEEYLELAAAWLRFDSTESVSGTLRLRADGGTLVINDAFDYSRVLVDGVPVSSLSKNGLAVFFSGDAACTAGGKTLTDAEQRLAENGELAGLLESISLDSRVSSSRVGNRVFFELSVDPSAISQICERIAPASGKLGITYDGAELILVVTDGKIASVSFSCRGTWKVVVKEIPVTMGAELLLDYGTAAESVPEAVRNTLIIPEA